MSEKEKSGFLNALEEIKNAEKSIKAGSSILVLSDRGVNSKNGALPSLLVAGTLHHHLIRKNLRDKVDLIYETGEAREVHHFALLFGYGISAINPFIALDTVKSFSEESNSIKEPRKLL